MECLKANHLLCNSLTELFFVLFLCIYLFYCVCVQQWTEWGRGTRNMVSCQQIWKLVTDPGKTWNLDNIWGQHINELCYCFMYMSVQSICMRKYLSFCVHCEFVLVCEQCNMYIPLSIYFKYKLAYLHSYAHPSINNLFFSESE